jgi:hypothetical protein
LFFVASLLLYFAGVGDFILIGFSTFLDYYTGIQIEKKQKETTFGFG